MPTHAEKMERRLRIISFLFVAAAIFLAFGSLVFASHTFESLLSQPAKDGLSQSSFNVTLLALVTTERFVNRCLFMALLFMQLGVLFILYLLLGKLQVLEKTI